VNRSDRYAAVTFCPGFLHFEDQGLDSVLLCFRLDPEHVGLDFALSQVRIRRVA